MNFFEKKTDPVEFVIPGPPKGKARHRSTPLMRNGKPVLGATGRPVVIAHSDAKTVEYENLVRLQAAQAMQERELLRGALAMEVRVFLVIPMSWSKKKRAAAYAGVVRPTGKPDWDNLGKAISDGCNGIVFTDDSAVTSAWVTKRYAAVPRVEVSIWQEGESAR
ncbi:MAG: RusA family crossover junction endodeoxyribonuclease [Betaproteobacteria bacterium]|nr:RusA family crossover junction endodeoxyribonuclease [Betaproteobacteria bacterium]